MLTQLRRQHARSMARYAKWRIKPTEQESRAYNTTDRILLTFDDYGDAERIAALLKILKRHHIKAAFFLVGRWSNTHPELVADIVNAGHWIGNHTYSHQNLVKLSEDDLKMEVQRGPKTYFVRPPYGIYNPKVRRLLTPFGYKLAYWTIDSKDWTGASAERILERVIPELHPGACILMHINAPHTLEVLPELIKQIRAKGYTFCREGTELAI